MEVESLHYYERLREISSSMNNIELLYAVSVIAFYRSWFPKTFDRKRKCDVIRHVAWLSRRRNQRKWDEIIAFAEIGDFIDRPVKTYSSGMFAKLAFSITAILETDIMLIDEILSVGDAKFKKKSYEKMKELIFDHNRTVMIVSHNPDNLVKRFMLAFYGFIKDK